MSKGSPRVTLRIPDAELQQVLACIDRANEYRRGEPYDLTSWILAAIREKMAHGKRSRRSRKPRKAAMLD